MAKRHCSLKSDFTSLLASLSDNPAQGIELFAGVRKIRMAISSKGRGKSGGARIIFTCCIRKDTLHLLFIYDKQDMDNVEDDFIRDILAQLLNQSCFYVLLPPSQSFNRKDSNPSIKVLQSR